MDHGSIVYFQPLVTIRFLYKQPRQLLPPVILFPAASARALCTASSLPCRSSLPSPAAAAQRRVQVRQFFSAV
jgi:hypothetical protein